MENKKINISKFILGLVIISVIMDIPHLMFGFDLLSIFSIFFYRKMRIYSIIIVVYCLLIPVISLQYFDVGVELCPEMWRVMFASNIREVSEYVGGRWLVIGILMMVCVFISWFCCHKTFPVRISLTQSFIFFLIGISGFACCSYINAEKNYKGTLLLGFKKLQPILYPSTLLFELKRQREVGAFDSDWNNYRFGINRLDTSRTPIGNVVVLVIGESSRYDHWFINGYGKLTTPRLAKVNNLYTFRNVSSPASATLYSVPLIMTSGDAYRHELHYRYKGVIDAFKEGKYYTVYLTNQEETMYNEYKREYHYQAVDTLINTDHFFEDRGLLDKEYDEKLLPYLEEILRNPTRKNIFVCIHLMGSHKEYTKRYPKSFDKFENGSLQINKYGYDREIAHYDNTILYTDFVLSEIINKLKESTGNVALLYTSDHGENLKDNDKQETFHSVDPNKYTIHIPYFIWMNDNMVAQNPFYDSILKSHIAYPLSASDNTMFTLLQLGNLYPRNEERRFREQNILSNELKYSEQKVYAPFKQELKYTDLLKN